MEALLNSPKRSFYSPKHPFCNGNGTLLGNFMAELNVHRIILDSNRKTLDGNRKTLDGNRKTLDGNRKTLDGNRKTLDGNRKTLDGHFFSRNKFIKNN